MLKFNACLLKGTVPDDQLDLSDIPEITNWSNAVRHNQFYRPVKQQTSIRLDADVLPWFKVTRQRLSNTNE